VPSTLPLHFCDCEEHCGPSESANQTYLSALDSAAHEKELSIMYSVMNKLLKESGEQEELAANLDVVELVENKVAENREDEREEEVVEEVSEEESDEDLVINISSRVSDESLLDIKVSNVVPPKQVWQSFLDFIVLLCDSILDLGMVFLNSKCLIILYILIVIIRKQCNSICNLQELKESIL
jgi:SepF-like predicted cell division protein (DUF552 family)